MSGWAGYSSFMIAGRHDFIISGHPSSGADGRNWRDGSEPHPGDGRIDRHKEWAVVANGVCILIIMGFNGFFIAIGFLFSQLQRLENGPMIVMMAIVD